MNDEGWADMNNIAPSYTKTSCEKLYAQNLLKALNENRKNTTLNDGVVVIGGRQFPIQRCVLAAAAPYFRALYDFEKPADGDVNSKSSSVVTLDCISSNVFEDILDYIYTGSITLKEENIEDILQASDLLLMHDLKELCCDYLEKCICASNCLGIMEFAEQYTCSRVQRLAKHYIQTHFSEVYLTEEFLLLSVNRLREILQDDRLEVHDEDVVIKSLLRWISNDEETRRGYFKSFMADTIRVDSFYTLSDRGIVAELMETGTNPVEEKHHFPRGSVNVLVVVGGCTPSATMPGKFDTISSVRCTLFPPETYRTPVPWIELAPLHTPRRNHAVASAGGFVYTIGGQSCNNEALSSGERYDPSTNSWTPIAPMKQPRCGFCLAVVKDKIYAIGSARDQDMITAEVYNIYTDQWRCLPRMRIKRHDITVAVSGGLIYVIGGILNSKLFDTVEIFDPEQEIWYAGPPLAERRFQAYSATCGEDIYVFGGFRPLECPSHTERRMKLCQTEAYYPNSNPEKWIHIPNTGNGMIPFPDSSYIDGAFAHDEHVFIVGYLNVGGAFHFVRGFNTATHVWTEVVRQVPPNQKFGKPCFLSVSKACLRKMSSF